MIDGQPRAAGPRWCAAPGAPAREGVADEEVLLALWEHGVDDLRQVKTAVLEADGTISVVLVGAASSRTRRLRGRKSAG
jgi:uncharacterized membrane protein YcaP (DUF421 family)